MQCLQILAGPTAYARLRDGGLSASDVRTVLGASGAAKWLTIYGLDRAIFGQWLPDAQGETPIDLFGTSIGAFKLAAAGQSDPASALSRLAEAYIAQSYPGPITPEIISGETADILAALLPEGAITEILSHPRLRFHCGAVRCRGGLASPRSGAQKRAMAWAFLLSMGGRGALRGLLERAIFSDSRSTAVARGADGHRTDRVDLSEENFVPALLASGSIPIWMNGIDSIPDAPAGMYRDGGLLDYHPIRANFWPEAEGLVLYPHFYPHLKAGWFDKFYPWSRVEVDQLDEVVLLAPTAEWVASLPGGRIPDRKDFYRFRKDDSERVRRWTTVAERSHELGDEFLELVGSGAIQGRVSPIV